MSNKPRDWFSIQTSFTVTNADELFEFLRAASMEFLEEADADYEINADSECSLAKSMLHSIGVSTEK